MKNLKFIAFIMLTKIFFHEDKNRLDFKCDLIFLLKKLAENEKVFKHLFEKTVSKGQQK